MLYISIFHVTHNVSTAHAQKTKAMTPPPSQKKKKKSNKINLIETQVHLQFRRKRSLTKL